jgi:hypothetical protein
MKSFKQHLCKYLFSTYNSITQHCRGVRPPPTAMKQTFFISSFPVCFRPSPPVFVIFRMIFVAPYFHHEASCFTVTMEWTPQQHGRYSCGIVQGRLNVTWQAKYQDGAQCQKMRFLNRNRYLNYSSSPTAILEKAGG